MNNPYPTLRTLKSLDRPVLIFHGEHDEIIPVRHGRSLSKLAPRIEYIEYPCGHNDFPGLGNVDAYWDQVQAFVERADGSDGEESHRRWGLD